MLTPGVAPTPSLQNLQSRYNKMTTLQNNELKPIRDNDNIASKTLILQQHRQLLRHQFNLRYFARLVYVLIFGFIISVDFRETWMEFAALAVAIMVSLTWCLEAWTVQRTLRKINSIVGRAEEGLFGPQWEDAQIEFEYFRSNPFVFRIFEPIAWACLSAAFIFSEEVNRFIPTFFVFYKI